MCWKYVTNHFWIWCVHERKHTIKSCLFVWVSLPCHSIPNQTRYNTKATWPKIPSISRMRHIATFQMMKSVADYTGTPSVMIYAWLLNENLPFMHCTFWKSVRPSKYIPFKNSFDTLLFKAFTRTAFEYHSICNFRRLKLRHANGTLEHFKIHLKLEN